MPVFQVMNITDVDDKIISKARALKMDSIQVARLRFLIIIIDLQFIIKKVLEISFSHFI